MYPFSITTITQKREPIKHMCFSQDRHAQTIIGISLNIFFIIFGVLVGNISDHISNVILLSFQLYR